MYISITYFYIYIYIYIYTYKQTKNEKNKKKKGGGVALLTTRHNTQIPNPNNVAQNPRLLPSASPLPLQSHDEDASSFLNIVDDVAEDYVGLEGAGGGSRSD